MWESEIRSNPDKHKTPALWVTRSKENLVQDGKDNILPLQDNKYHDQVSNRWKKKPPQAWIFIKQLKILLSGLLNPQQSVATVTQGKNGTVLETPKFQKQERSYAFPTWLG